MNGAAQDRPDGRQVPQEVLRLRQATRALRIHLDTLPVDFDLDASTSHMLAGLVFVSARQRYSCAESLIGAGFGGTTMGSLSRSLFFDGLRWMWIGSSPARLELLGGELLLERSNVCRTLDLETCSCPNLGNWLEPVLGLLPVAAANTLPRQALPSELSLLAGPFDIGQTEDPLEADPLLAQAANLLDRPELRGSAHVLAHAGHGNYLGLQSSLSETGAIGFDLRFDHEALFLQMAAAGVVAAATGSSTTARQWLPDEVPRTGFLEEAIELCAEVTLSAVAVHGLSGHRRLTDNGNRPEPRNVDVHRTVSADPPTLYPTFPLSDQLKSAVEHYSSVSRSISLDLFDRAEPTLHSILAWSGSHSTLESVVSTFDQPGGNAMAPFGARALLEEAARTHWRFSAGPEEFAARATQFFDEFRARRTKAINRFRADGIGDHATQAFFSLPSFVDPTTVTTTASAGRQQIPSATAMIRSLGEGFPEPGWLVVAYSLLSQATHATPLGLLHNVSVLPNGNLHIGELTPQLVALSVDVACLSSSMTLGVAALVIADLGNEAREYRERLSSAAAAVHSLARMHHGLD